MWQKNLDILRSYFVIYLQDKLHTAMIFSIVAEWIQSKTLTVQDISCPIKTKRQLKTKGPDWTSPHHGQTPQEWRAPFPCDASSINWMDCLHVVVQWVWWRSGGRGETDRLSEMGVLWQLRPHLATHHPHQGGPSKHVSLLISKSLTCHMGLKLWIYTFFW